ncbi:MerR family transcriptional regulator [Pendulispora rubella]|uniref:MerR family transcriptional regulator n=1 Tax=Pendulispora rubella TaxID=2741070 RepID=A0ABZ2L180_9BACT
MMLSIGAFSRWTGLSIKALRMYDAGRILMPAEVDRKSGYRRYRLAQMADAQRILALRQMGMPLAELRHGCIAPEERAALLALRRTLQEQMETLTARLNAVDDALAVLDTGGAPPVVLKRVPHERVVSHRHRFAHQAEVDALLAELCARHRPVIAGTVWHDCGSRSGQVDAQVFLLPRNARPRDGATELPATWSASCLVGHDDFDSAYQALKRWLQRANYRQAGPYRELQYRDETDAAWLEVQLPIVRG